MFVVVGVDRSCCRLFHSLSASRKPSRISSREINDFRAINILYPLSETYVHFFIMSEHHIAASNPLFNHHFTSQASNILANREYAISELSNLHASTPGYDNRLYLHRHLHRPHLPRLRPPPLQPTLQNPRNQHAPPSHPPPHPPPTPLPKLPQNLHPHSSLLHGVLHSIRSPHHPIPPHLPTHPPQIPLQHPMRPHPLPPPHPLRPSSI